MPIAPTPASRKKRAAAFVRRIGVRMQEADAERRNAGVAEEARGGANAVLVERAQLLAEEIKSPVDFADVAQRHDALRLHPEIRIAVALGHGLPSDLQNMAEALRDDEAEAGDLALQQRVGRDRRPVRQHGKIVDAGAALAENGVDAADQCESRV